MRKQSNLLVAASVLAFSFAPGLCLPALAADAVPQSAASQTAQAPSAKFIQDLGDQAVKIITDKKTATDQRDKEFAKLLNDSFDLKTIGRFVIGRAWNTATPEQQAEYMDLFKSLIIKNYGNRMSLAAGENFQVVGSRPESDTDLTVQSQVTHSDGSKPTSIDWRVRQKDGKMSVIDVIVEGISLSVTQRQEYASIIQNDGGKIDGLLDTMRNQLKGTSVSSN